MRKFMALMCLFICVILVAERAQGVVSIAINEVNFPDANLRSFVKVWDHGYNNSDGKKVGANDGFLTATEITDVTSLNWYNPTSTKGIEYFPNLEQILCQNGILTELHVSSFSKLKNLFCDENRLTNLDVTSNHALVKLQCYSNKIESLNVSDNPNLELLICVDNPLGKLDVSRNLKLQVLRCGSNDLKVLDVTNNTLLTEFECWSNHLTQIDLSKNTRLTKVLLGVQEVDGLKVKKVPEGHINNSVKNDTPPSRKNAYVTPEKVALNIIIQKIKFASLFSHSRHHEISPCRSVKSIDNSSK